ncbi:VOC family protein [Actinomadura keratinilytica]
MHVDDFACEHARLLAAGVPFEEAPRCEPYGTVAVFRDPYGNRWDLIELGAVSPGPAGCQEPAEGAGAGVSGSPLSWVSPLRDHHSSPSVVR